MLTLSVLCLPCAKKKETAHKKSTVTQYSAITPAITFHPHGKYTVDPHAYASDLNSIFIQKQKGCRNGTDVEQHKHNLTQE